MTYVKDTDFFTVAILLLCVISSGSKGHELARSCDTAEAGFMCIPFYFDQLSTFGHALRSSEYEERKVNPCCHVETPCEVCPQQILILVRHILAGLPTQPHFHA